MKTKIWIRLGGYIQADKKLTKKILNGDSKALVEAVRKDGFEMNGESYIPSGTLNAEDVDFFTESVQLKPTD